MKQIAPPQDPGDAAWTTVKHRRARSLESLDVGKDIVGLREGGDVNMSPKKSLTLKLRALTHGNKASKQRDSDARTVENIRDNRHGRNRHSK